MNGHGSVGTMAMYGNKIVASGIGGPIVRWVLEQTVVPLLGGFMGPGYHLTSVGGYEPRSVEKLNLGPSFMFIDSCFCGKINGIYPKTSITMAYLHAGCNAVISSTTGSNIAGGYLEPKRMKPDIPPIPKLKYLKQKYLDWPKGKFQDPHFGYLLYENMCKVLKEKNATVGFALREAKNNYLPQDADWELWWSPPLIHIDNPLLAMSILEGKEKIYRVPMSQKGTMLPSKYTTFFEFTLYGDPAFNPYVPGETN